MSQIENLSQEERQVLLRLARQTLELGRVPDLEPENLSPRLREHAATFVTLTTREGALPTVVASLNYGAGVVGALLVFAAGMVIRKRKPAATSAD